MQAAVVAAVLAGQAAGDLAEVAIVQVQDSKIDHVLAAQLVLEKLAPYVTVHQYQVRIV
jgi:hypothetical protein